MTRVLGENTAEWGRQRMLGEGLHFWMMVRVRLIEQTWRRSAPGRYQDVCKSTW